MLVAAAAGCGVSERREAALPAAVAIEESPAPAPGASPTTQSRTDARALFERDGVIQVYSDRTGEVEPLEDAALGAKARLGDLSAAGDKLLIVYDALPSPPTIGIYERATNRVRKIVVNNDYALQLQRVSWADDRHIVAEGHLNPSVTGYVLYDADSGEEINACGGSALYQVMPDGRSLLFGLSPHIYPEPPANVTAMTPDRRMATVYTASAGEEVADAAVSSDLKRFAVWTRTRKDDGVEAAAVRIGDYDADRMRTGKLTAYPVPPKATGGELTVEPGGAASIATEAGVYRLEADGRFRLQEAAVSIEGTAASRPDALQTERLAQAVASRFGDGASVNDAVWFEGGGM